VRSRGSGGSRRGPRSSRSSLLEVLAPDVPRAREDLERDAFALEQPLRVGSAEPGGAHQVQYRAPVFVGRWAGGARERTYASRSSGQSRRTEPNKMQRSLPALIASWTVDTLTPSRSATALTGRRHSGRRNSVRRKSAATCSAEAFPTSPFSGFCGFCGRPSTAAVASTPVSSRGCEGLTSPPTVATTPVAGSGPRGRRVKSCLLGHLRPQHRWGNWRAAALFVSPLVTRLQSFRSGSRLRRACTTSRSSDGMPGNNGSPGRTCARNSSVLGRNPRCAFRGWLRRRAARGPARVGGPPRSPVAPHEPRERSAAPRARG
jgi:hypothetical protein